MVVLVVSGCVLVVSGCNGLCWLSVVVLVVSGCAGCQ